MTEHRTVWPHNPDRPAVDTSPNTWEHDTLPSGTPDAPNPGRARVSDVQSPRHPVNRAYARP